MKKKLHLVQMVWYNNSNSRRTHKHETAHGMSPQRTQERGGAGGGKGGRRWPLGVVEDSLTRRFCASAYRVREYARAGEYEFAHTATSHVRVSVRVLDRPLARPWLAAAVVMIDGGEA